MAVGLTANELRTAGVGSRGPQPGVQLPRRHTPGKLRDYGQSNKSGHRPVWSSGIATTGNLLHRHTVTRHCKWHDIKLIDRVRLIGILAVNQFAAHAYLDHDFESP